MQIWRMVCLSISALESNTCYVFWVCFCILLYSTCMRYATYFQLWSVPLYHVSQPHLTYGFGEGELLNMKCVFWFSLQCLSEKNFNSKKNTSRYYNIYLNFLLLYFSLYISTGLHVFLSDFNGNLIFFSRQIFRKLTNIQFRENPSIGSRVVPCE